MIDDVHEYLVRFVALADELNTRFTVVVVPHAAQIRREFPQNRYQRTITEMAGRLRTSVIDSAAGLPPRLCRAQALARHPVRRSLRRGRPTPPGHRRAG